MRLNTIPLGYLASAPSLSFSDAHYLAQSAQKANQLEQCKSCTDKCRVTEGEDYQITETGNTRVKTELKLYEEWNRQTHDWIFGSFRRERVEKHGKHNFTFNEAGIEKTRDLEVFEALCLGSRYIVEEAYKGKGEFPKIILLGHGAGYNRELLGIIDKLALGSLTAGPPLLTQGDIVLVGFGAIEGELVSGNREERCIQTRNPDSSWNISNGFLYIAYEILLLGRLKVIFNDSPELSKKIARTQDEVERNKAALYIDAVKKVAEGKHVETYCTTTREGLDLNLSDKESVRRYTEEWEKMRSTAETALKDYVRTRFERLEKKIIPCIKENLKHRKVYQILELDDLATHSVQNALRKSKIPYIVVVPALPPLEAILREKGEPPQSKR